ncbi:MAG TPA: MATE family efflux transporter, partial [Longimicrobiaceae bacterium]|nr:MATE family efflux transporter [Longimicrobiaceae bacterium]
RRMIPSPTTSPPSRPGRRRGGLLFRREARELLWLAGPIVLSQLGGVGMNTTDTILVGPLGADALAAVGLASSLHTVMIMVCSGVLFGMSPLVSRAFGAGDRHECRHVLVQGLWLAVLLSVPVFILNLVGGPLTRALRQPEAISVIAGDYMTALAWGVLPYLLFTAFRQFLEGMGLARAPMVITLIGLLLNLVVDPVLIYGIPGWVPAMGAAGSGWATTAVRWAMFAAMGIYVLRHPDLHPFRGVRFAPEGGLLRRIVGIGVPSGAQAGLEVGLFTFAAVMMGWIGAVELAAHQVTINIAATTFMVALGVSIAGSIRVGQNLGAERPAGVRRAVLATYLFSVGFMALCALLFLAIPRGLIGLYTSDPAIIRVGVQLLFMAALFQVFDGTQVAGFAVLRGAADTRVPMLVAALGYWAVGVPVAYLLAFHSSMGPVGIWAGLCVGLATAGLLLLRRVRRMLL